MPPIGRKALDWDGSGSGSEFPPWIREGPVDRRAALKFLGISALLTATASCGRPPNDIVPYVNMPEHVVPGEPTYYATAVTLAGYAQPVLGKTFEGRPVKLEPNPNHPNGGASNALTQAAILSLYDPDRSRTVLRNGEVATWDAFLGDIANRLDGWRQGGGGGLRLLTGPARSPSLRAAIGEVMRDYPQARWHQWDPLPRKAVHAGTELAFGQSLEPRYRFGKARSIVALDADFLGPGPHQSTNAAAFAEGRRARQGTTHLTRLRSVEPTMTLTGAAADRRLALRRSDVGEVAKHLARVLGAPIAGGSLDERAASFVEVAAEELRRAGSEALVLAGDAQPPEVHALAHWMNRALGATGTTINYRAPASDGEGDAPASLSALVDDMRAGAVETLLIFDSNPAYSAPSDLGFTDALANVSNSIHHGVYADETAAACAWHLPALHELERWGDAEGVDGTVSLIQPLITPLFGGRSAISLLGALAGRFDLDDRDVLRSFWSDRPGMASGFEEWWREALSRGFVSMPTAQAPDVAEPSMPELARLPERPPADGAANGEVFEIAFFPDASVWDGSFANNAWLQELPDPLTKLVWGNAAHLAPADAKRLGITDGDMLRITVEERGILIPALVSVGQAEGSIALHLGYGRTRAGEIGTLIGVDVGPLRKSSGLWDATGARVAPAGARAELIRTQTHDSMEGRDIVRRHSLHELAAMVAGKDEAPPPSLYPDWPYDEAWAMVIDQSVCIGCNACVTACQAENNIPVVGPEEVARGREMHWLRIDRYIEGPPDAPEVLFQPVPCMHCEKAPCEPVCPVEASVHDSEGLNLQVYNRCIGTRFCEANCPYKVRRFNFYGYGDGQQFSNLGDPLYAGMANPDVTVRSRGVMEKCTYCVQRLSRARRTADENDRPIADGEVRTACQEACPTRAIVFGSRNDSKSAVAALKKEPHEYDLLGHLGTRPRTSYLARIRDGDAEVSS